VFPVAQPSVSGEVADSTSLVELLPFGDPLLHFHLALRFAMDRSSAVQILPLLP